MQLSEAPNRWWGYIVAANQRIDDKDGSGLKLDIKVNVPTIVDPSPPPGNLGDTPTASQLEDCIDSEL